MKIEHNKPIPGLCGIFLSGELTEKEPYCFSCGGFVQYLTKPEWEALKKYAMPKLKANDSEDKPPLTGLELLKAKYAALEKKNSKEGVALRAEIKNLKNRKANNV